MAHLYVTSQIVKIHFWCSHKLCVACLFPPNTVNKLLKPLNHLQLPMKLYCTPLRDVTDCTVTSPLQSHVRDLHIFSERNCCSLIPPYNRYLPRTCSQPQREERNPYMWRHTDCWKTWPLTSLAHDLHISAEQNSVGISYHDVTVISTTLPLNPPPYRQGD